MAQRGRETFGHASLEAWEYMSKGGFGLVYKAKLKDQGANVVVKVLDADDGYVTVGFEERHHPARVAYPWLSFCFFCNSIFF